MSAETRVGQGFKGLYAPTFSGKGEGRSDVDFDRSQIPRKRALFAQTTPLGASPRRQQGGQSQQGDGRAISPKPYILGDSLRRIWRDAASY
jgi:hypothetical protein